MIYMNFYQSDLRRYINQEIYQKPIFELSLFGKEYFGIVKSQRRLGKTLNRYMIHGIEWVDLKKKNKELSETLAHIRRDYAKKRGDIFFQFGFLDEFEKVDTKLLKDDEKKVEQIQKQKMKLNQVLRDWYELLPSWREHMPDTTIKLNLTQWIQALRSWYSKSGKRYINKAKKEDLSFDVAKGKEWSEFWEIWYSMAYDKWFSIVTKQQFIDLMDYLTTQNLGWLYIAKKWRKIVSWSVVLHHELGKKRKELIYLYGATNREFGSIWWHYRLTDQIMKRWAKKWYEAYDLLGVAPPWNTFHYLAGVSRFKQSFGGKTIMSSGNYDMVFNSLLYRAMQVIKRK